MQLRPYQEKLIENTRNRFRAGDHSVLLSLATGGGKCLGRGTPVLMFDGTVKPVEDIVVGDQLIGPDSKPRHVLSTCSGTEQLYRVTPKKGDCYVVNESHILSLRLTSLQEASNGRNGGRKTGDIWNLSVRDYLAQSKTFKHLAKGWRSGVEWDSTENLTIDPYFLGVWLGDGTSSQPAITSIDPEIVREIHKEASRFGIKARKQNDPGKAAVYHLTCGNIGGTPNPLRTEMRSLGLFQKKHIPLKYKRSSRTNRLELLAGIIDSDGHLSKNGVYDLVFKSKELAEDIIFCARSLGLSAYLKNCRKTCVNNGVTGDYYRFTITGDVDEIPVRIPRKKSAPRKQKKNVLNVGINVSAIGEGEYFGFEIDGDHLFLLGDFTVTHNTYTAAHIVSGAAQKRNLCWWLCHRKELADQASDTFHGMGIPHGLIRSGYETDEQAAVQVASIPTISRRLDKLREPDLIIFDESHHIGAASWDRIFRRYPHAKIIGLTATPWRLDGKGLGNWFDSMVEGPSVADLIEQGSLSPYRLFAPATPDLSGIETQAGDYKRSSLARAMDKPSIVGDAIGHYRSLCMGKRAVVFAVGVEHSRHIAAQFNDAGIPAEHVDGTMTSEDRDAAVERFRRGETLILSNAELFGEGFDVPAIEAAILLRPTKSLSLYLQQCGRALRPMPGKDAAIILDHAGNSLTHGLPDDPREWSLEDRERKKRSAISEVPIRQCKSCFFVYRPAPKCPQCGHAAPAAPREIETVDGILEEVKREAVAKRRAQGQAQTLEDLQRIERERGYRPGWARHVWASRQRRAA